MDPKFQKRSDLESLNRVVCVMGYICSSSCLLLSSLDNHSNVLSFHHGTIRLHFGIRRLLLKFCILFSLFF